MSEQPDFAPVYEFDLSDRLAKSLRETGISRSAIARYIDVRPETISSWCHGRTRPTTSQLRDWERFTGYALEWLRDGKAPAANDGGEPVARPKGFEPLTF